MAPSFDYAVSSLLCVEENVFDDNNDHGAVKGESQEGWCDSNNRTQDKRRICGGDGLALLSDECISVMVEKECHHLPVGDYLKRLHCGDVDIGARKEAIDWIRQVHAYFSFGPLCAYLAMSYLDRFLSSYELPKGKAWTMQLLAVACLSLAAKVEETEFPFTLDLQSEQVGPSKFVFEAKTIHRMELLVLSTLRWRMQAVTPFSFIDTFLLKIDNVQASLRVSLERSSQLILSTIQEIDFLEFKPSEVAAAVAISVAGEIQTVDTDKEISVLIQHVEQERVLKCVELLKDLSRGSVQCVPQSPSGVLDVACLSYRSDEITDGSCANSSRDSVDAKRRRLARPCEV